MIASISDKQVTLIRSLLTERAAAPALVSSLEADLAAGKMTTKSASVVISMLFALPRKPKAAAVKSAPTHLEGLPKSKYALATADLIGLTSVDPDGNDTLFFEVKEYKGVTYMRRLIGAPGDFLKVRLSRNDEKIIAGTIRDNPKAAAKEFAEKFSCCAVCAAPLTDQTSRDLGLGPVCRNRF